MTDRSEDSGAGRPAAEPFPEVSLHEWRERVERELGEGDFESELVGALPGGIRVEPLYTEAPASAALPMAPVSGGWLCCTRCELAGDPSSEAVEAAAEALSADLAGGCTGVVLSLDSPRALASLLAPVAVPIAEAGAAIFLDHERGGTRLAESLVSAIDGGGAEPSSATVGLGVDPIAADALFGGDSASQDQAGEELAELAARCHRDLPQARAVAVSSRPFHEAGAHPAQELGWALASLAHYLRLGERQGLSATEMASQVELRVAMERDTFVGIAKLRALRSLWARLLAACGAEAVPAPFVHAFSSERSLARRAARLNLVRVASQTLAAVCGDADAISAAPWDRGIPTELGADEVRAVGASSRRLARNTQHILAEEAHLGRSLDPAAGSYYLETLTDRLARAGWEELRRVERMGGMVEYLHSGRLGAEVDAAWEERLAWVRDGRLPIVGVTVYPDPGEAADVPAVEPNPSLPLEPLPRRRDENAYAAEIDEEDRT